MTMNARKLAIPLLAALACIGAGLATMPAAAATKQPPEQGAAKVEQLRVKAVEVGTKAGPLTLRVAAGYSYEVGMTVNGRRVRHPFSQVGSRTQEIELRSADGLRAGANEVRIQAWRGGVRAVATRTVTVPGWALVADAGEDTQTITHRHARVGAAPAVGAAASAEGGDLRYSWRVVERPRGVKPRLIGRGKAQPLLRAGKSGSYVLQLKAESEDGGEPASFDRVVVAVAPPDPPIGVPITTLNGSGAISIAGQTFLARNGNTSYVVLERTTRAVVASGLAYNDSAGMDDLAGIVDKYSAGTKYLMVVSGQSKVPDDALAGIAKVFRKLGAAPLTEENFAALRDGQQYSAIGIPGSAPGAATTRIPGGYLPAVSGAIAGYLQPNQPLEGPPLYEFVSPENPVFDTVAAGSDARKNVMTIDGRTFTGALTGGATAGFHVVVLESLSLRTISDEVLVTNGTGNDRTAQATVAKNLATDIQKPGGPTVFVQTIGKPKAAGPEWDAVVTVLHRLGANSLQVYALNGSTEYGLVSRLGATAPPAEASTAYDHGPYPAPESLSARLVGSLARSRTSNFVPNVFGASGSQGGAVNVDLLSLPYRPAVAWPELAPGATRVEAAAAARYICQLAKLCLQPTECDTLRECFWQDYAAVDWTIALSDITKPKRVSTADFKADTFEAVQEQLSDETANVARVKSYLTNLLKPLQAKKADSYVDLQDVGTKVWESVQKPAGDNSRAWALGLIGNVISVGSFAPPPTSNAARGLAAVFALGAYLATPKGQPILGSEIKAKTSELGQELLKRVDLAARATNGLGVLIASDYGKLKYANEHIYGDWKLPDEQKAGNDIRIAAKQWFYQALIPVAYPYLIRTSANVVNARNLDCQTGGTFSWPSQPDMFQMAATVGYNTNGTPQTAAFFFAQGIGKDASPPKSLGDEMFRPRSQDGLGIEKMTFFTPRVFNGKIAHAANGTWGCKAAWMPRFL